jgi:hypothetical protein
MAESGRRCLAPLDARRTTALVGMLDEIRAAAASSQEQPAEPIRGTKTETT